MYESDGHIKERMGLTTWKNVPSGCISQRKVQEKAHAGYTIYNKTQPIELDFDKVDKKISKQ